MSLGTLLDRASQSRSTPWWIAGVALALSLLFCFAVYPSIREATGADLDPDEYGSIGLGIWKFGQFRYDYAEGVTVFRGPVYPYFLAATLAATGGWWPYCAQLAQCFVFAGTTLLAYWMGAALWGRRTGVIAAAICAVHPMLIWYTSRIWIDCLLAFLYTLFMCAVAYLYLKPNWMRVTLLGATMGVCALAKSVYLPLVLVLAASLWIARIASIRQVVWMGFVAALVISPWTLRNYMVTGKLIPIHIGAGMNISEGDTRAEHWTESPLAFGVLFEKWHKPKLKEIVETSGVMHEDNLRWQNEIAIDKVLVQQSMDRYKADPWFLVNKIGYGSWQFWIGSQTAPKTIVLAILQIPLLVLFSIGMIKGLQDRDRWRIAAVQLLMVLFYTAPHIPMEGQARYALPLVPTLVVYASVLLSGWTPSRAAVRTEQAEGQPSVVQNG